MALSSQFTIFLTFLIATRCLSQKFLDPLKAEFKASVQNDPNIPREMQNRPFAPAAMGDGSFTRLYNYMCIDRKAQVSSVYLRMACNQRYPLATQQRVWRSISYGKSSEDRVRYCSRRLISSGLKLKAKFPRSRSLYTIHNSCPIPLPPTTTAAPTIAPETIKKWKIHEIPDDMLDNIDLQSPFCAQFFATLYNYFCTELNIPDDWTALEWKDTVCKNTTVSPTSWWAWKKGSYGGSLEDRQAYCLNYTGASGLKFEKTAKSRGKCSTVEIEQVCPTAKEVDLNEIPENIKAQFPIVPREEDPLIPERFRQNPKKKFKVCAREFNLLYNHMCVERVSPYPDYEVWHDVICGEHRETEMARNLWRRVSRNRSYLSYQKFCYGAMVMGHQGRTLKDKCCHHKCTLNEIERACLKGTSEVPVDY